MFYVLKVFFYHFIDSIFHLLIDFGNNTGL
jgi:succinate dehydrogenase/fumarate reductase cytochrome b subunit